MAEHGIAFLMYHELALPGRAPCNRDPGYVRYVVPLSDFSQQMERLASEGWSGVNVSDALHSCGRKSVCLTFDDGCETDLISAAPVLQKLNFGATFYITIDFLGKQGYMSRAQVRDLRGLGFEIGCHSMSHPYLPDIDDRQLNRETHAAKQELEQIAGIAIEHFSCPGGRWDRRVVESVRQAGFKTMATSRTGVNFPDTNPFALNRVAILKDTDQETVMRTCRGEGLGQAQFKESAREAAKRVLGNSAYDSLRALLLGKGNRKTS